MKNLEITKEYFGQDNLTEAQLIELGDISDELANIIIRGYVACKKQDYVT